jgi:uncharacterized transporter YbjL
LQPFTVILGIVLGSLVSIAFSLSVVLLVFWILYDDHPRFSAEMPEVVRGTLIFTYLAIVAGLSFFGTLTHRTWRFAALALLWVSLLAAGYYYWPE